MKKNITLLFIFSLLAPPLWAAQIPAEENEEEGVEIVQELRHQNEALGVWAQVSNTSLGQAQALKKSLEAQAESSRLLLDELRQTSRRMAGGAKRWMLSHETLAASVVVGAISSLFWGENLLRMVVNERPMQPKDLSGADILEREDFRAPNSRMFPSLYSIEDERRWMAEKKQYYFNELVAQNGGVVPLFKELVSAKFNPHLKAIMLAWGVVRSGLAISNLYKNRERFKNEVAPIVIPGATSAVLGLIASNIASFGGRHVLAARHLNFAYGALASSWLGAKVTSKIVDISQRYLCNVTLEEATLILAPHMFSRDVQEEEVGTPPPTHKGGFVRQKYTQKQVLDVLYRHSIKYWPSPSNNDVLFNLKEYLDAGGEVRPMGELKNIHSLIWFKVAWAKLNPRGWHVHLFGAFLGLTAWAFCSYREFEKLDNSTIVEYVLSTPALMLWIIGSAPVLYGGWFASDYIGVRKAWGLVIAGVSIWALSCLGGENAPTGGLQKRLKVLFIPKEEKRSTEAHPANEGFREKPTINPYLLIFGIFILLFAAFGIKKRK